MKLTKSAAPTYRTQVWEVKFTREGQRSFVKSLCLKGAINIWQEQSSTMDILVEGSRAAQVAGMLHEREVPYSVAMGNYSEILIREHNNRKTSSARGYQLSKPTMNWTNYHRLDVIYEFMHSLAREYPYLCTVVTIGHTSESRELKMLKISNGDPNNTAVWVDGGIHPREWITVAAVTYIADQLVRTYHEQATSVTNKDWYILPVMNPDGYEYTHTHDRMWRKNRRRFGECVGVDLNRNFSHGFGVEGEEGSSDDAGSIFYRGPEPFSELESKAVKQTILKSGVEFKVFLSFHSYAEVIIFPWGYTNNPCPDYVELLEGGVAMSKAMLGVNGRTYKVGSTKDLMYYAAGTSVDWSYGTAKIPYSYMIELRSKKYRFLLPKEEIIVTASEALSGVVRLMQYVDRKCVAVEDCTCPK